jgi:hypothetical protein
MTRQSLNQKYDEELNSIQNQIVSLGEIKLPIQSSLSELITPLSQLDERIAELTVDINKKIYDISIVSGIATACGCGTFFTAMDGNENPIQISVGTTYYYEQAKAHRVNAENPSYSGFDPFANLDGYDGSTSFTSGIGSNTIVVGADQNSILELVIDNVGSGIGATNITSYYGRTLVGGVGTGAKADIVVSAGGSVSSVIINNGGTGYDVNQVLNIPFFPSAAFRVTSVGSPILGVGTDTYIVASSGIGSIFIPTINSTESSTCGIGSTCGDFVSQVDTLKADIVTLRSQRDAIMVGSNSIKGETTKSYVQRYSYNFAEAELNKRKTEIDVVRFVLNNPTYNQYFS